MPKVSVIVPVYNVEKYIRQCLDSLVGQTLKDIEIILVNDGSSDKCPEICDEYASKDNRIKVIHRENGGICVARNTGLDKACGRYIVFVDSDDYCYPDYCEILVKYAELYDADFVVGQKFNGRRVKQKEATGAVELLTQHDCFSNILELETYPHSKLYARRIIQENKLRFDEDIFHAEDALFNITYLQFVQKAVYIYKQLYYYRATVQSVQRDSYLRKLISRTVVNTMIHDIYREYAPDSIYFANLRIATNYADIAMVYLHAGQTTEMRANLRKVRDATRQILCDKNAPFRGKIKGLLRAYCFRPYTIVRKLKTKALINRISEEEKL